MKTSRAILTLGLFVTAAFTLGTCLQPRTWHWSRNHSSSGGAMQLLFGDSRRLFANQLFVQADVTFHSGYYPSFFDEARMEEEKDQDVAHPGTDSEAVPPSSGAKTAESHRAIGKGRHVVEGGFMGKPADWIERFGRNFIPSVHTHLQGKSAEEILPWLKFSADLDPHRIETYLVTAYWLDRMHQPNEAVRFVRAGLRQNPGDPALLYELGHLYFEDLQKPARARTLWLAARERWQKVEAPKPEPNKHLIGKILGGLVEVADKSGQPREALKYLRELKTVSPHPDAIQKLIEKTDKQISIDVGPSSAS